MFHQARLVLSELTYISPPDDQSRIDLARDRNHLHSSDLPAVFPSLQPEQTVVFVHSSSRYGDSGRVAELLGPLLPAHLRGRVGVLKGEGGDGEGGEDCFVRVGVVEITE
ncbi:hypothetical protein TeGR_g6906 [Tetraparma gracilis]|jgi:hypothetical protein|uniref:Uncharacterized protein n=1 Tax=Tetraparma gracilis TaxID=2962635 RepID=A0ABQ6MZ79_9STRA|nr:hypothetical protein TeGR_g6906 [Tetraparma gracilis]